MGGIQNFIQNNAGKLLAFFLIVPQLITIVLIFRQNLELAVLIIFSLIWTTCFLVVLHLHYARVQHQIYDKKVRKFSKGVRATWTVAFIIFTFLIILVGQWHLSTKRFVTNAIMGSPTTTPNSPFIENFLAGEDETSYHLKISIINPLPRDILIKQIWLHKSDDINNSGAIGCLSEHYDIDDHVVLISSNANSLSFQGEVREEKRMGTLILSMVLPIRAVTQRHTCYFQPLSQLKKNSLEELQIFLPKQLKVISYSYSGENLGSDVLDLDFYGITELKPIIESTFEIILTTSNSIELRSSLNLLEQLPPDIGSRRAIYVMTLTAEHAE